MKIVNRKKFIRTISILVIIIISIMLLSKKTYSKGEVAYVENYIYSGDTLWSIANNQIETNKYFENKNIREVINELKDVNNLKESNLQTGEKIIIPTFK